MYRVTFFCMNADSAGLSTRRGVRHHAGGVIGFTIAGSYEQAEHAAHNFADAYAFGQSGRIRGNVMTPKGLSEEEATEFRKERAAQLTRFARIEKKAYDFLGAPRVTPVAVH